MMHKRSAYIVILMVFLFASCEDKKQEPTPDDTITLQFKTQLFNQDDKISVGDTVLFNDGTIFNLKLFKLYLTNIKLINDNNEEVLFEEVVLLDVGDDTTGIFEAKIAAGNYTGMTLGFGVDSVQNNADPTSFADKHPLSSYNQMYWTMLKYRFAILEGRSNVNGAFDMQNDVLNAYHPGTDPLYQTKQFNFDNQIFASGALILLNFDLPTVFYNSPAIDLETEASTHSEASDIHIAQKFMTNLAESASVEVVPPPVSL